MTIGGQSLLAVAVLTGVVTASCSNMPTSPSAVTQSSALAVVASQSAGAGVSAPGLSAAGRLTPLAGGATTTATASSVADLNVANNSVTVTAQVKAPSVDTIKVTKCYTNATTTFGQMLIKASSSDPTARLFAYRPDGTLIGEVQNGGGSRYGGTVMPWQPYDPVTVTIRSSSGGTITVPTTPFQI